jgi:hypothetical protein
MTEWKPYLDDRLILHKEGYVIIKPADAEPAVPLCCPLCDSMMRDRLDEEAFVGFGCCNFCALLWAHPRRAEWKSGWRPEAAEVKRAVAQRPPISVVVELE